MHTVIARRTIPPITPIAMIRASKFTEKCAQHMIIKFMILYINCPPNSLNQFNSVTIFNILSNSTHFRIYMKEKETKRQRHNTDRETKRERERFTPTHAPASFRECAQRGLGQDISSGVRHTFTVGFTPKTLQVTTSTIHMDIH